MKKFLYILLGTCVFILQPLSSLAFYDDVPTTHPYYKPIKTLQEQGLLPEEANNKFRPDDLLRKTELYKFLLTYGKAEISSVTDLPYADTNNTADYAPYIQTALNLNILIPIGQNQPFNPALAPAKRQVLNTMFSTLGIGTNYFFDRTNFIFTDVNPESDLAPLAQKTAEIGIFDTEDPSKFSAARRLTRGEAADYLYKINQYSPQTALNPPVQPLPTQRKSDITEDNPELSTFVDVWDTLQNDFLYKEQLDNDKMLYGAIQGLLTNINDIYTVFQEPAEAEAFLNELSGDFEGIGIIIELIDGKITIISPLTGSPAEKMGLKPNDVITKINDENIVGKSLDYVAAKIRGPSGSQVKIAVLRSGKTLEFIVDRDFILISTVNHKVIEENNKQIGYLQITTFGEDTDDEFAQAVDQLTQEDLDGIILDLRNNPGGYMTKAIEIIGYFTQEAKKAVILEFNDGSKDSYLSKANGKLAGYETVILINEGSASASEILAGALQDYKTGKLIGTKSFGKGRVQQLNQYDDNSIFKYTVSKWLTPLGRDINEVGLAPDKIVERGTGTTDLQLNTALAEFN